MGPKFWGFITRFDSCCVFLVKLGEVYDWRENWVHRQQRRSLPYCKTQATGSEARTDWTDAQTTRTEVQTTGQRCRPLDRGADHWTEVQTMLTDVQTNLTEAKTIWTNTT